MQHKSIGNGVYETVQSESKEPTHISSTTVFWELYFAVKPGYAVTVGSCSLPFIDYIVL